MGIIQTIKNIFKRSNYVITNQSLNSITDHPKIAISPEEYICATFQERLTV